MPRDPRATEQGVVVVVQESVHVELPPEEAFRLFTDGINEWWPLEEGYSYGGHRAREIFLEPAEGGRFYERFTDGDELQVGTVRVCSPPDRILFTWRSPDWQAETEVDVRFVAEGQGTTSNWSTGDSKGSAPRASRSDGDGAVGGHASSKPSPPAPLPAGRHERRRVAEEAIKWMWSLGDYREVAPFLLPHAEALVASSSIAPVVLGGGKRLFDETVSLEHQRLLQSPFATHITYRIVR